MATFIMFCCTSVAIPNFFLHSNQNKRVTFTVNTGQLESIIKTGERLPTMTPKENMYFNLKLSKQNSM